MTLQIFWGSLVLIACSILHVLVLIAGIRLMRRMGKKFSYPGLNVRITVFLGTALGIVILVQTIHVWIWALSFVWLEAIPDFNDSMYFALVTYTTLGYGDITLEAGKRIFAAMAAVTGLIAFGLSTAFLFAVFRSIVPPDLTQ